MYTELFSFVEPVSCGYFEGEINQLEGVSFLLLLHASARRQLALALRYNFQVKHSRMQQRMKPFRGTWSLHANLETYVFKIRFKYKYKKATKDNKIKFSKKKKKNAECRNVHIVVYI